MNKAMKVGGKEDCSMCVVLPKEKKNVLRRKDWSLKIPEGLSKMRKDNCPTGNCSIGQVHWHLEQKLFQLSCGYHESCSGVIKRRT